MAQISAEEVANGVGLAADELSKPCDSNIIPSLADCFREWEVIFGSLLSEVDVDYVNEDNPTGVKKRTAALRKWRDRKGREATYKVLVDALLSRGERYQAEILCRKILADHSMSDKNGQIPRTTTTDYEAKESESDIQFQCPCGECLLETYLQDGCPKSYIPYLGMTSLSKEDQENLNYILKKDTKKIMESFTDLSNGICDSLIRRGVTVENLVRVAVNFDSSLRDELKKSKSINEAFTDLAPEMSFFNHEILAKIINVLGDKDDKDHLADYSKEFKEFCKRKVFEVEPGLCTCGQRLLKKKQRKLFAVVLPTGEKKLQNLGDAVSIKETLSDILGVPLATLHLHRIDRGSVILVFSVPDSIAEKLFPLPKEKLALLKLKGMVPFIPQDSKHQVEDIMKPLACSADMHETSSEHTPTVPSGTPGELLVSHSLPTSAQFSWTPVPEDKQNDTITGYTVHVEGPDSTQEIPVMDGNATSCEVSDLRPYTTYTFSICAMTEAGAGPPLSISSTTPQGAPSGKPGNLRVHHRTQTSAQLSWTPVPKDQQNGIITGYTVQVTGPDFIREISITDATATSTEVSGLRPSTSYYFSVSAMTVAGTGPPARSFSITPQEVPTGTPGELLVNHSLPNSAQLSWTPVPKDKQNYTITGYRVTVQGEGPDSMREILVMDGNATTCEVSDLRPHTTYTFSVSAMTEAGTGPPIRISSVTPQGAPSGSPKWLTVRCNHPTSVKLFWGAIPEDQWNGEITGYSIQVEGPDTTRNLVVKHCFYVDNKIEVCDLKPSTEYSFSVSAVTVVGSGPAISVSFVTPQEALSNTIGNLKTSQYHPTSAQISWEAVKEESDHVIKTVSGYTVQVEGPDSTQVIQRSNKITSVEISNLRPSAQYTFKVSAVTVADTKHQRVSFNTHPWLRSKYGQSTYSWKSFFTATSGKNTAQYRMMLESTPNLKNALADRTNVTWLTTELEKARFIVEDQRKSLETIVDADTRAAKLISMVINKVHSNSENFTSFRDVLKKDEATYEHILAKMKDKVPSGTPGELLVSHSLPTSAQLSWTPVPEDKQNDTITGYTVQIEGPDSTQEIPVMDGNATSYEVSDLRPNTTYTFGVSAMTEAGVGPPIIVSSTTPQAIAPSGTPTWLTVRGSLPTSVQLSWGAVPEDQWNGEITDYSIQIEGHNTTRNIQTTGGYFTLDAYTSEEVSDLRSSTEYTFSVSAVTVAGSGPAISVSFITPQEALSNTIGSLRTSQYHPTSAQISWETVKEADKTVSGYTARVEGPDSTQVIPINDDITTVEILDLRPSTQYTFKVSAVTVEGIKPQRVLFGTRPRLRSRYDPSTYSWKSFFMATSGKNTAQYKVMMDSTPSLKDALADDTNITWLAIELEKTGLITKDQRESLETSIDADTRAAELISMVTTEVHYSSEKFTTFRDVLKKDEATYGHILAKMKDRVPSGTPGELLVSHSLPTSAQFSWTPVPEDKQNDTITGYTVHVKGPDSTQEIPVMDGNATSYEVSDLRPYTTYTFGVSAMTEAGAGPPIIVSSTTPQGAPSGTPKLLIVRCSLPTSVQLSWGAVPEDQQNGEIIGYSIQIKGPNTTRNIQTTGGYFTLDTYTSEEVSDLRPSTEYTFSVSAVTVAGSGPAISVSFVTPQEALSNTIGNFKTSQNHPILARISWDTVKKDVTVRVEGPDSTQEIPITCKYITSVEISDLSPSTEYTFKVSGVTVTDTKSQRAHFMSFEYLSKSTFASYSWKSFFTATSGKNTAQYRMMLEYAPSLEDTLADVTNLDFLAMELTQAGLITKDQMRHVWFIGIRDAKVEAANILIGMITIKVYSNSENFTTFLDVLKNDERTYGHILAKMKEKGLSDDPVLGLSLPSLELPSHPFSQELAEHKAGRSTAGLIDDPLLGLSLLPPISDPIKHKSGQSTDRASLSTVLPKGYIKSRHLNIIKWEDESRKVQQFYLTEKIAHKWRTIGELVGLTYSKLQSLDHEYRDQFETQQQEECCQAIFDLWLDNPPPKYPPTWQGLIDLLEKSQLDEVATELRTVLSKAIDL